MRVHLTAAVVCEKVPFGEMPGARGSGGDEGEGGADEGFEGLHPQLLFSVRYTKVVEPQKVFKAHVALALLLSCSFSRSRFERHARLSLLEDEGAEGFFFLFFFKT